MKVLMFILLIVSIGCSQNLQVLWSPNPETDQVTEYIVYKWEGSDTTVFNESQMDSIGTVNHIPGYTGDYSYRTDFTQNLIIRAGCRAENIIGRRSLMAYSPFYRTPLRVDSLRINK